jgi:nucleotide-binding universal stress UspA family protein
MRAAGRDATLFVKGGVMARILLATDGSPSASLATQEAIELGRATGWPLTIVTVWHISLTGFAFEPVIAAAEISDAVKVRAQEALRETAEAVRKAGIEPEALFVEGLPADEICALAEEREATLIVVGSHGWGTMQRLLFGSVSRAVLQHAPCPVLVVRAGCTVARAEEETAATAVT